jgi:glyoxylase-like metal-dependent hydrolase (beta-lactamase superfamily II)
MRQHGSPFTHMIHPASELENSWFTVDILDESTFGIGEYGQWMKIHSYLFIGDERAALVDTGLGVGNIRTIVDALTQLPVDVVTTHAHWDHTGGHHLFERFSAHVLERDWIEDSAKRYTKEIGRFLVKEPFTKAPPAEFDFDKYRPFHSKVDMLHADGDIIDLGGRRLEIIHTPGHSPGHVCTYEEKSGYLVTGDLLYRGVLLGGLQYSDPEDYHRSLLRLQKLPYIGKLLPGHGRLDIDNDFLDEASEAFDELADKGQLKKKSGLHNFKRLKVSL